MTEPTEPTPTDVLREIAADMYRILNPIWMAPRLRAAANELDRLRAATAWQPIGTAPQDGTRVLVFETGNMFVAAWFSALQLCPPEWHVTGEHDGAWAYDPQGSPWLIMPTHWQPLPPPPETAP